MLPKETTKAFKAFFDWIDKTVELLNKKFDWEQKAILDLQKRVAKLEKEITK